jgi:hypothetical protein
VSDVVVQPPGHGVRRLTSLGGRRIKPCYFSHGVNPMAPLTSDCSRRRPASLGDGCPGSLESNGIFKGGSNAND